MIRCTQWLQPGIARCAVGRTDRAAGAGPRPIRTAGTSGLAAVTDIVDTCVLLESTIDSKIELYYLVDY